MTTATLLLWLTGFFVLSNVAVGLWFLTMTEERAAALAAKKGDKPGEVQTYRTMGVILLVSTPIIAGVLLYAALSGMVG